MRKSESARSTIVSKSDIIEQIKAQMPDKFTEHEIEDILDAWWESVVYFLKQATEDKPIFIRANKGLQFTCKVTPESVANRLGDINFTQTARRKAAAKITRFYQRTKINDFKN